MSLFYHNGIEAPATPPAVAPELTPLPYLTPHSRGTAAHAQTLIDERYRTPYHGEGGTTNNLAGNLSNIVNVQCDLKGRERCNFITKRLRQIMILEDDRTDFKATADDRKRVDLKFKIYLDDAVEFVNVADGDSLKEGLRK